MVYLSDRNMSAIPKENDPYSFVNNELKIALEELNKFLDQKEKENKIPFNKSVGHELTYDNKKIPGPGAYNIDIIPKKPLNQGNNPFLFQSQRFKKTKSKLNIPGPGAYNIALNNLNNLSLRKNKSQIRPSSNISSRFSVNSSNNIATIPAKKQEFGYTIKDNGDLVLAPDPIADFRFSGTKNDSIGPGRYNPVIKEKNHCIRWDKSSGRNTDASIGLSSENIKNEQTQNSSLVDTDISTMKSSNERKSVKKPKPKPFKIIRYKNHRENIEIQNDFDDIDIKKEMEFLNHQNNIISGPKKSKNYLSNYKLIKRLTKPEEFQFFGSSNERNTGLALILSTNTKVGPGSYFHNTYKKFQNLYLNTKKYSWEKSRETEGKFRLRRSLSNLGPGSYNIDRSLEKKSFNSFGNFSMEKRFSLSNVSQMKDQQNEYEEGNPGPGSYNLIEPWTKDITKMVKKPILVNAEKEIKKIVKIEKDENQPDFNNYQKDHYINIIQENIKKKANPYESINTPFLSGDDRFKPINKDQYYDIGPGKYDLFKKGQKTRIFHSILAPFNSLEQRNPKYIQKTNNNVAPGEYSKDSYFDWNKKSFNTMFMN